MHYPYWLQGTILSANVMTISQITKAYLDQNVGLQAMQGVGITLIASRVAQAALGWPLPHALQRTALLACTLDATATYAHLNRSTIWQSRPLAFSLGWILVTAMLRRTSPSISGSLYGIGPLLIGRIEATATLRKTKRNQAARALYTAYRNLTMFHEDGDWGWDLIAFHRAGMPCPYQTECDVARALMRRARMGIDQLTTQEICDLTTELEQAEATLRAAVAEHHLTALDLRQQRRARVLTRDKENQGPIRPAHYSTRRSRIKRRNLPRI